MKKLLKIAIVQWLICIGHLSAESSLIEPYDSYESCCNYSPNNEICLSCPCYTFDFEFDALYLQPYSSNLHYVAEALPLPLPSPNWKIRDIRPDYHFGYDVGVSAICHDRNTKARLNYIHFNSRDSDSLTAPSNDMVGPFFEIGPDATPYTKAKGHVVFHYDALNLDYGVCVKFGDYLRTNFFGGIGGVRIKQKLNSKYSNSDGTLARSIKVPSSFLGMGPQLGVDFSYGICDGLHLTGEGIAALLVGNLKNHTSYASISPALAPLGIAPPNKQSTHVRNRTQAVPAFEGKLGLAYEFTLCNCAINVDAGYKVLLYINAIQSVDIGSEVVTPPLVPDTVGVFARTFQRNLSNFALAGPYLELDIGF